LVGNGFETAAFHAAAGATCTHGAGFINPDPVENNEKFCLVRLALDGLSGRRRRSVHELASRAPPPRA
jgi:hypothetical protein